MNYNQFCCFSKTLAQLLFETLLKKNTNEKCMCIIGSLTVLETKEQRNGQIGKSEPPSIHLQIQAMRKHGLMWG